MKENTNKIRIKKICNIIIIHVIFPSATHIKSQLPVFSVVVRLAQRWAFVRLLLTKIQVNNDSQIQVLYCFFFTSPFCVHLPPFIFFSQFSLNGREVSDDKVRAAQYSYFYIHKSRPQERRAEFHPSKSTMQIFSCQKILNILIIYQILLMNSELL